MAGHSMYTCAHDMWRNTQPTGSRMYNKLPRNPQAPNMHMYSYIPKAHTHTGPEATTGTSETIQALHAPPA